MAMKVYIQTEDIVDSDTTYISVGTYVNAKNLTNASVAAEAAQKGQTFEVTAKQHIVSMYYTEPSIRTLNERNKFANQLDDFATFYWANTNMFAEFGAFIVNDKKGSLKMNNGPSFKNSYSQPQFQNGYTNLTGVTFSTQTISFTVGVYWISIEDYRVLMNLLHPYEINMLSFSFEKTYGYYCKLQSIKDSTRYVVGHENTINTNTNESLKQSKLLGGSTKQPGPRYYTELNLTFEVIGAQCAKELTQWSYLASNNDFIAGYIDTGNIRTYTYSLIWDSSTTTGHQKIQNFISDLSYPFLISLPYLYINDNTTGQIQIAANMTYTKDGVQYVNNTEGLCDLVLKNIQSTQPISVSYDSEYGLIYWSLGAKRQVLNLLSTQFNGERIVQSIDAKQFEWPGRLSFKEISDCVFTLTISITNMTYGTYTDDETPVFVPLIEYNARRRTNVL